jgi:hypothetical protein
MSDDFEAESSPFGRFVLWTVLAMLVVAGAALYVKYANTVTPLVGAT